ncbi:ABC-F family ATP-binding cassette domain-containing protein [bacterium]|nr:ABC-F family ATP-binding cassette domain-containing protein [bacterium]
MLQLVNITVDFGGRALFRDLSWQINRKDRVALIGANGVGKSTLLKIINKQFQPTSGVAAHNKNLQIGYLPQDGLHAHGKELIHEVMTAFEEVIDVHERMKKIEIAMTTIDHESDEFHKMIDTYGNLQHRFEDLDGFSIESKAAKVLVGLGFKEPDFTKMCELFSGGWQMRIALAKLLLQNPDLLLLDEPTNHLDIESIEWLENYLNNYEGAILLVSHDRYFIDKVCNRITELDRLVLTDYYGDYESFEEQKAMAEEQLLSSYERQQSEIQRIQLFIDRFRYKASKARQAQSKIKFLDHMDKIQLPDDEKKAIQFRFPQPQKSGRVVLDVQDISKSYDGRTILKPLNLTLERGEKVALIGANGAGKSTLLRIISGFETPDSGSVSLGHNVTLEYFAQQQSDKLDATKTAYEEVASSGSNQPPLVLRTILGAFLFSGDDIYKKVGVLSGGEKSRLAFAKMLLNPANFIILDEPTNHIDAQSKEILQGALTEFQGTLLIVSHDRHFMNNLVNKVIEIRDGKIKTYLGNFDYYHDCKLKEAETAVENAKISKPVIPEDKVKRAAKRDEKKKLAAEEKKHQKKIADIERAIQEQEKLKLEIETELSDPEVYKKAEKSQHLQNQYHVVTEKISKLYEDWQKMM